MSGYRERWGRLTDARRATVGEDGAVGFYEGRGDGMRSPFEVDYERVMFSLQFRQLARKTQVHPFAEIDHVHNRLTHSLEVASVSHTLAKRVGKFLEGRGDADAGTAGDIRWICQAAGLAHDIGNPAYGHSGEEAIQAWAEKLGGDDAGRAAWNDYRVFDGNAQAFRLLARDDLRDDTFFRFTLASLGALVKHPRVAGDLARGAEGPKKLAAFSGEEGLFRAVWGEMGLVRADGSFMRHPLSYLTEAADDICYRILDFEDAVTMGIFAEGEVAALFRRVLSGESAGRSAGKPLQWLRGMAIHDLTAEFARLFEENYEGIMRGEFEGELKDCLEGDRAAAFGEIRERYGVLFSNHRKVIAEIGSYGQFAQVLNHYYGFLGQLPWEGGEGPAFGELPALHRQLIQLAWDAGYYEANRGRGRAWWIRATLDFVSGMTDDYLNRLARVGLRGDD